MNNALVDSSYYLNDSTLSVRFKMPATDMPQTMQLFASAATCTIAKDTAQIVLLPGLKPLPPDTLICGSVNIRLTPGKWGSRYLWQNGSTDSVFVATDTGRYSVQVQNLCGGMYYDTINISRPAVSLGADTTICKGDSITLHATTGFQSYQWLPQTDVVSISGPAFTVKPGSSIDYSVAAQTNTGCTVSDTIRITVLEPVDLSLGNDRSFCEGDSLLIQAPANYRSYHWNTGDTGSFIQVKNAGVYWLKAEDMNGCFVNDSITILPLYPKPVVTIQPEEVVCLRQTDTLRAGNFSVYKWNDGSTGSFLPVTDTGKFWLEVKDVNGCTGSDSVFIKKKAIPPFRFLPADTVVCAATAIELRPDKNYNQYLWNTGSSFPFIETSNQGVYTLQVKDNDGCVGTDSIIITHKYCPNRIVFPTAFTPNDDNRNDIFKPYVQGRLVDYRFTVYNRWGQAVFSTNDYRKGWDGYLAGSLQNTGAFVWLCQYQFAGEEKKTEKGSVMLIR